MQTFPEYFSRRMFLFGIFGEDWRTGKPEDLQV